MHARNAHTHTHMHTSIHSLGTQMPATTSNREWSASGPTRRRRAAAANWRQRSGRGACRRGCTAARKLPLPYRDPTTTLPLPLPCTLNPCKTLSAHGSRIGNGFAYAPFAAARSKRTHLFDTRTPIRTYVARPTRQDCAAADTVTLARKTRARCKKERHYQRTSQPSHVRRVTSLFRSLADALSTPYRVVAYLGC